MGHKHVTSKKVASKAGKALASKKTPKAAKSIAGSALSQSPGKHKKHGKG